MKGGDRRDCEAAAARAASLLPRERLHPAVVAWADSRPRREAWSVALSGGSDSVGLLVLLWAHWPRRRERLVALHFNHRLRGAESAADARFCARLCGALGIRLVRGAWKGRRSAAPEAEARAARFAFFGEAMGASRSRVLWLGHQKDDIAESMLMRLARGSGTGGLSAPRPLHELRGGRARARIHARPLLTLKRSEIAGALRKAGVEWREDPSNASRANFRGRVRRSVIGPWARSSGRDAVSGAALSRELLEEDDAALEAWAGELGALGRDGSLALGPLSGRPRAVARRVLRRWLAAEPRAGELSRQAFEALLAAALRGTPARHSLGNHGFAVIRRGVLRFKLMRNPPTFH
ncbi:MAG TPA: tRNA lysidine(34) synthetase TilS [Opitutaceae bacterium]|jgi:tRNA(Ile)-lysidine synthase